jgi:hypothetical protein
MVKEKVFLIPESLGNAIINYLAEKPFREVGQMIQALTELKEAESGEVENAD